MKLLFFAILLLLTVLQVQEVDASQPMDFLVYRHSMTITVKCMDEALVEMGNMPGFELSSSISIVQGHGQATRKVLNHDINATLQQLRQLGEVTHSASEASNVFTRWASLRAEINVRTREYDRLMELLHGATTMAQFNQIETRLREVIAQLERIQGQLNALEFERGSSQIAIVLNVYIPQEEYEEEPEPEAEEEPEALGRLARIGNAFTSSAGGTFVAMQAILILLAYISLPLVAIIAIAVACKRWLPKRKPKTRVKKPALGEAAAASTNDEKPQPIEKEDFHIEEVETDEEN